MKIAYIVPYVPNLIRTRPYNLISQLSALGHDVTVFTLGSSDQDQKDAEALRSKVSQIYYQEQPVWYSLWNSMKTVPTRRPLQTVYSWNEHFADQMVNLLSVPGAFDVVHVEHLRGSKYGQHIKSKLSHIPVVWDSVDCISYLFEQASSYSTGGFGKFVTRFELGRTRLMEGKLLSEFNHVLVTSETDKNSLLELALPNRKTSPISVLSNGVDLKFFHSNPSVQRDPDTLVFSGKMSYHANISMVEFLVAKIMPKVWIKRSKVRLVVVGKDPTAKIRALETDPRITVTGTVDDIRPYLWEAAIALAPLVYGAGIQNKILEAMSCGTPVITSPKTLSSLQVVDGEDLIVADQADDFSEKILMLLENQELQEKIGAAGEKYVRNHHDWSVIANQLISFYSESF